MSENNILAKKHKILSNKYLELEVTNRALIQQNKKLSEKINELKKEVQRVENDRACIIRRLKESFKGFAELIHSQDKWLVVKNLHSFVKDLKY